MPTNLKPIPTKILQLKKQLLNKYEKLLSKEEMERSLRDPHRLRPPRWCGVTIHTTINCPFRCLYCYIEDMGFKFENPRPYPLTGRELVYALLNNPAFFPSLMGTLISIGSISEPFIFVDKILDFLKNLSKLGNPIQFSTKQFIDKKLAEKLGEILEKNPSPINPLVTIVTLENHKILEPNAPPPEKRLKTITNLREAGFKPVLFFRPIIPSINDGEIPYILEASKEAGAYGVVFGSFRVTKRILEKLDQAGLDTRDIRKRVRKIDDRQRAIFLPEKENYIKLARKMGLIPWKSACCANSWNAGVPCASACFIDGPTTRCPNLCSFPKNSADEDEVTKALNELGIKFQMRGRFIKLLNYPFPGAEFAVRTLTRRATILSRESKKGRRLLNVRKKIRNRSLNFLQTSLSQEKP
ncbi:MAG: radical SAM protein [Candidatus Njordarchaeia archaeon]